MTTKSISNSKVNYRTKGYKKRVVLSRERLQENIVQLREMERGVEGLLEDIREEIGEQEKALRILEMTLN